MRIPTKLFVLFALIAGLVLLVGCGGGSVTKQGDITIEGVWMRPSPMAAGNGAAYMVISNSGDTDDALIAAKFDAAEVVEIHESYMMEEGGDMDTEGEGMGTGMMGMRPVEKIVIPADGSATLEPGGLHVMLIGLTEQLEPGQTATLTLVFENAGEVQVEAEVRAE
jgi:copper(I)-binding protein